MLELVDNGGPVVALLLVLSTIALTVALYKLWQFRFRLRLSSPLPGQAMDHLARHHQAQALMLLKGSPNPRCALISHTLELLNDARLSLEQVRDDAMRRARLAVAELGHYLRVLEVIASLAPLLGLFGTVLGMIESFQAMEAAGEQVNPAVLSGGIWEALLTTAVGLAVAMPVSILHAMLERRVEVEAVAIQDDLEHLFTLSALGTRPVAVSQARSA